MIKLTRILAPANGADFEDICSFSTKNYVGIWDHEANAFALFAKSDYEFHCMALPYCESMDELDDAVYAKCDEHIEEVSESSSYEFRIIDGEDK